LEKITEEVCNLEQILEDFVTSESQKNDEKENIKEMKIQRQKQLYEEIIIKFENSNSLFKSMVLANEHDRDLLTVIFIYYNKVF
jgi:hypothetical protein